MVAGPVTLFPCKELRMDEIAISKFKATCLAVLERVRKTGKAVIVTRFGQPIARIAPPTPYPAKQIKFGTGSSYMIIQGDLFRPISDNYEWEAARDLES